MFALRAVQNVSAHRAYFQLRSNKATWPSYLALLLPEGPFQGLVSAIPFAFLLVVFIFQTTPKYSAEVLSNVPKRKKVVMCDATCLMKKTYMLDKIYSGMNYSTVGFEFNVHESTLYIK